MYGLLKNDNLLKSKQKHLPTYKRLTAKQQEFINKKNISSPSLKSLT